MTSDGLISSRAHASPTVSVILDYLYLLMLATLSCLFIDPDWNLLPSMDAGRTAKVKRSSAFLHASLQLRFPNKELRYFKDEMRAWCSKWVYLKQWRVLVAGCMITLLSTCHNIKYQSQHLIWLHQWSYQDIRLETQRVVQNFTTWPCLWC